MPTPHVKLLLHALRLGQPQDPQAALAALGEALTIQAGRIDELARQLAAATQREQSLLARLARLESDRVVLPQVGALANPASSPEPPFAAPPAPPASHDRPRPRSTPAHAPNDGLDDFALETLVVKRAAVDAARAARANAAAPFELAPPSRGVPPARASIPGSPWSSRSPAAAPVAPTFAMDNTMTTIPGEGELADLEIFPNDDTDCTDPQGSAHLELEGRRGGRRGPDGGAR
jgi:hypothetical protein